MSCGQTQPVVLRRGVRFRHDPCSATKQAGTITPRLLHALSVEESRRMLPHFLLTSSIYRGLIRIWPIWRNPHQYTPDQPGVCDDVNLKTLVQTRMGDMNGFQISDLVFGFPTRSIAHHKINMQNKQYFPALKPANLKEAPCMAFEVICELADL